MKEKELLKLAEAEGWHHISQYQKLSEKFIEKHKDKVDWNCISRHQKLSEKFIEKYKDEFNWYRISHRQKLSEKFIEKHKDIVDWGCISRYQKLSEKFIEKHKDIVNWYYISGYQKLSEKFIEKHKDRVVWNYISEYQKLSEKFIEKHKDKIDVELYHEIHEVKTLNQKLIETTAYAKKHNLKINKTYLYAFRNHDMYGRGVYNKTISYKKGVYYRDWHCDMRKNEDVSFGLGIWPEGNTSIKMKISDWGVAVNKNDGKARVWGFEIV